MTDRRLAPTLLLLPLLLSCGDGGTAPPADTQAPQVVITSPTTAGSWETGETSLTITGTASDDVGVTQVTWAVAGETGTASGTTSWNATVPLAGGANTVTIRARDEAGNEGTATLAVTVDDAGPTLVIEVPAEGGQYLTPITPVAVSGTASDDSGVDRVEWSIEGGVSGTADGTTAWSIPTLELDEGENVLTVTAFDAHDNEASATLTFVLDQTPPALTLGAPGSAGRFNTLDAAVDVAGTASDSWGIAAVEWSIAGGASGTATGTEAWEITGLPLAFGENEVTVTAFDLVGNAATETFTAVRLEALAGMSINPAVILTNSSREIRVTAAINPSFEVGAGVVRLAAVDEAGEVVEEIAVLRDNGDLDDGDEILSDGVYSALVVISRTTPQELRLQVIADITGGATPEARSPVRLLAIHPPTAPEADQLLDAVQQNAAATLKARLQQGAGLPSAIATVVDEIAEQEGVESVEANGETAISIVYESGLLGGLVLAHKDGTGGTITRGGARGPDLRAGARTVERPARTGAPRWSLAPSGRPASAHPDTIERAKGPSVPLASQTRGERPDAWAFTSPVAVTAANGTETDILNRKVLIYAPYEAVWDPYNEGPDLVTMLAASNLEFDLTYLSDQEATIAELERLTEYGLVVLATHGSGGRHLLTGEVATEEKREEYDALRQAGQIVVWTYIEIGDDGGDATVREDVFGVTDAFIDALPGTFPQSLIVNNSCESTQREDLSDAFLAKGAATYVGHSAVVSSKFAVDMVLELIEPMVGDDLATVGEAFTPDQVDPHGGWGAVFELRGSEELRYSIEFSNPGFELGGLGGWTAIGDGRVIIRLGNEEPVEGQYMAIISTGLGFTTTSGAIYQTFVVPAAADGLRFHWNFLSEEFLEWIGTEFQDRFDVYVIRPNQSAESLFAKTVDDIAADFVCPQNGGPQCTLELVSPEIVFDQGEVYMTGWQTLELDLTPYRGQVITLVFGASDVGDSIYDTAILLDGLVIY